MKIRFTCPQCDQEARLESPFPADWQCPHCDHLLRLASPPEETLPTCVVCGNPELYKKKDFPHWLGLTILTVACTAFLVLNFYRHQWWAWTILIGSAVFDGVLYLLVGDAVVCYRCGAHYRGCAESAAHQPFELGIAERYRQERLRREQLRAEKKEHVSE
ncbi:MAG: hypothetical protein JO112_18750 [Planctomycetes bacterium]|nr:hypothetical protein [Planctomycetota bacterium]